VARRFLDPQGPPEVVIHGRMEHGSPRRASVWLLAERYTDGRLEYVGGPSCETTAPCPSIEHLYPIDDRVEIISDQTGEMVIGWEVLRPADLSSPSPGG
jgi:hypothetical protein